MTASITGDGNKPGVAEPDRRIVGVDGIRGLAALFVVLHHCYLISFPGFPDNTGPAWTAWLLYGHLSVAVFIVVSGFSLSVAPARRGWSVDSLSRFARRRAWRILPAYWAALVFSLAVAWTITPQPGVGEPTARSVLVYGFLIQDLVGAPTPNGAFWSIAVEAQLYCLFPFLLLIVRRTGPGVMAAAVAFVVGSVGFLATRFAPVDLLMRLTPQFAFLFALGVVAAGLHGTGSGTERRDRPWIWYSLVAAVPVVAIVATRGSVWWNANQFWIDLAIGPAVAWLLAAVATGRPAGLVRLLDLAPIRRLGLCSYSLYLIHAPIVVGLNHVFLADEGRSSLSILGLNLLIAVPVSIAAAALFAHLFEIPFQRHRSWGALFAAARSSRVGPIRSGGRLVWAAVSRRARTPSAPASWPGDRP